MARRPDLIDVWPFRVVGGRCEVLLLHRAPGRVLAGLWQGVSGLIEPGESIVAAAGRSAPGGGGGGGPGEPAPPPPLLGPPPPFDLGGGFGGGPPRPSPPPP